MAFKTYQISKQADGTLLLTDPRPLRLAGTAGVIAEHTRTLPAGNITAPWILAPETILQLAKHPAEPPRLIAFEQPAEDADTAGGATTAGGIAISRVTQIFGKTGAHTDLLITFAPLEIIGAAGNEQITVREPAGARAWSEGLKLNGGPLRPNSPWTWANADLNIGAAVFGTKGG